MSKRSHDETRKPKKDKNAPKQAKNSYMYFMEENRNAFKEAHPDADFGTLSRLIGDKWKTLTPEQKERYERLARVDKDRYANEMRHYVRPAGLDNGKKRRAKKDPNAPKGVLSSYIMFSNVAREEIRAANPEMPVTEIMKQIGARWRAMSADDKLPYEELSARDKTRFENEMAIYRQNGGNAPANDDGESDDESN